MQSAGNTLEAEASRGMASSAHLGEPCLELKNVFQFLRVAACFIHTAHEGNSSALPHFDLPTTNDSDRCSL